MHRLLSIIILFFGLQTSLLIKARLLRETLYIYWLVTIVKRSIHNKNDVRFNALSQRPAAHGST